MDFFRSEPKANEKQKKMVAYKNIEKVEKVADDLEQKN